MSCLTPARTIRTIVVEVFDQSVEIESECNDSDKEQASDVESECDDKEQNSDAEVSLGEMTLDIVSEPNRGQIWEEEKLTAAEYGITICQNIVTRDGKLLSEHFTPPNTSKYYLVYDANYNTIFTQRLADRLCEETFDFEFSGNSNNITDFISELETHKWYINQILNLEAKLKPVVPAKTICTRVIEVFDHNTNESLGEISLDVVCAPNNCIPQEKQIQRASSMGYTATDNFLITRDGKLLIERYYIRTSITKIFLLHDAKYNGIFPQSLADNLMENTFDFDRNYMHFIRELEK